MPGSSHNLQRVHLAGASGSGVTTVGRALAERCGWPYFDTDDFYWVPTDPPFRRKRDPDDRLARISDALAVSERWVLGGALDGWGDPLIDRFDTVVFLEAPTRIRIERLRARERQRFGDRIARGGDMHAHHRRFIAWAAGYEDGDVPAGRSRARQEAWLAALPCPVIRLAATDRVEDLVAMVMSLALRRE